MVNESLEPARWGEPVPDDVFDAAEARLGASLPPAWRGYLQGPRWLRRGWLESGAFIELLDPTESLDHLETWNEEGELHPGLFFLGTDGSRNRYVVDLRDADPLVQLTDVVSSGWQDCESLDLTVQTFVDRVVDGSFDPYPGKG